jgi:hypothetical protein
LDSVGRTFKETHSKTWINGGQGFIDLIMGSMDDPVRRVLITWNSGSMVAAVFHERRPLRPQREVLKQPQQPESDCSQAPLPLQPIPQWSTLGRGR